MNPADLSSLRKPFCRLLLGAGFALTLIFLATEIRLVRSPSQRDYGEGHVAWLTHEILDTTQAYKPVDTMPYVVYPYPPIYMLAARLLNSTFAGQLTAGRSLSLLSTLGIGVVLAFTVAFSSSPRAPWLLRAASGAFAGVLPLMMNSVSGWCSLMRVDMLALFLMYAGLAVYITLGKRERWQYAAAILFVLALFTKQTMLSAPLACLSVGFFVDWKSTMRVGVFAAALILASAWLLNSVIYDGFLTNILGYNVNPFSWKNACLSVYDHVRECWPWLAISAAAIFGICNIARVRQLGWRRFLETRTASLYSRAVLVAGLNSGFALASTVAVGKMGASYNYFLSWDMSTCLLCGLFMFRMLALWNRGGNTGRITAAACTALLLGLLLPSMTLVLGLRRSGLSGPVAGDPEIVQAMRQTSGPVFSENIALLIQAGKPVEVEPSTVTSLALTGAWDERPYVQLFDMQYFALLVAYDIHFTDRYSPAVTSAIERSYVREAQIGPYSVYRPMRRTSPAR